MMIVNSKTRVTLVGGGAVLAEDLLRATGFAPVLVAADGGANTVLAHGMKPDAVIGDLDSLDTASLGSLPAESIHHIPEQDSTDFDKALRSISAPLVLGLGFLGGRLDHELAALSGLLTHAGRRCILIGEIDLCFHAPPRLSLALPVGTRLSVMPLKRVAGRSEGLEWPLSGEAFEIGARLGASNRVTGPVRLEFYGAGMLVILPKTHLPEAIAALEAAS